MKRKRSEAKVLWNFEKIKPGEVFVDPYDGRAYIKIENITTFDGSIAYSAINLESGEPMRFSSEKVEYYKDAEYILNEPCEF